MHFPRIDVDDRVRDFGQCSQWNRVLEMNSRRKELARSWIIKILSTKGGHLMQNTE